MSSPPRGDRAGSQGANPESAGAPSRAPRRGAGHRSAGGGRAPLAVPLPSRLPRAGRRDGDGAREAPAARARGAPAQGLGGPGGAGGVRGRVRGPRGVHPGLRGALRRPAHRVSEAAPRLGGRPAEAAGAAALPGQPREPSRPVEIRPLPATRIAFARHVGPFAAIGEAWRRLYAFAQERDLSPLDAFGLGHDDPEITPPERYRYDACLPVGPEVAAEGSIGAQVVPAGRFAVALHCGPYEALGETYGYLLAVWLPRTGRGAAQSPSIERYLDDPMQTRPEDLRTEVWLRLEEAEEEAP